MPAKKPSKPQAVAKGAPKGAPKKPAKPSRSRFRETATAQSERVAKILRQLAQDYGDAECALHHKNAFELLVATILSAQCTDERVNMVTPALFKQYPTPAAFAVAPLADIETLIQSTGFFRNKAKSIKACSQALVERHGGNVPQDLDELVQLAGVGRKTANVVLGVVFRKATGVVVDTHVGRLCRRLGLTVNDDPVKVEADLMAILPRKEWIDFSHRLIHHGRQVCQARKPKCDACTMAELCPKIGVA